MIKYKNNPFTRNRIRQASKQVEKELKEHNEKRLKEIKQEYMNNIHNVRIDALETFILISLEALYTEFSFGSQRRKKYLNKIFDLSDSIVKDYITKKDLKEEYAKDIGGYIERFL